MNDPTPTETRVEPTPKKRMAKPASCVVFTPEEYAAIREDSRASGESIPTLLKTAFFKGKRVTVLMPEDDRKRWFAEIRSWGNNLNQIAKRVNSGIMAGWYEELRLTHLAIRRIEQKLLGVHGHG